MNTFLRTAFNYDRDSASVSSGLLCDDVSLAVQSDKDDADINTIVRRFGLTGVLPSNVRPPMSSDFVDIMDFSDAMRAIRQAKESFATMPADVRKRFANDPGLFVDFCTETAEGGVLKNLEEMRKLGLAVPKAAEPPPPEPTLVRVVKDDEE